MSISGLDPDCQKINESAYDYQTHSCLNLLENKPQINADERRLIACFYGYSWISWFSDTLEANKEGRKEAIRHQPQDEQNIKV